MVTEYEFTNFKMWLCNNTDYHHKSILNIVSRFRRANSILKWFNDPLYLYQLEQTNTFKNLSSTIKSQLKKAVLLYVKFSQDNRKSTSKKNMKVLSLFANIGVAEAYFKDIGIDVVIANELVTRRAMLYSKIYQDTHMICGDINNEDVFNKIVSESLAKRVDIIMATPPCQGMSTAGQQLDNDVRNLLVCKVIEAVKKIKPKYVFIENVPLFYQTAITINEKKILIPEFIKQEIGEQYHINNYTINTKDYSVPQMRERAIVLMTRKDISIKWVLPNADDKIVTMKDAIGHLPLIDPYITDVSEKELLKIFPHFYERREAAIKISPWNIPPQHVRRQVIAMQHTATGKTAFDNKVYYPKKVNGEPVKGYRNTYKRQNWDTPAYTVTMDNRKISSQNNVHPGRPEYTDENGETIYSDARTLTLYELMKIMTIPDDWPIPKETSEAFLRRIIGEGIPPLFVKKVFINLTRK